MRYQHEIDRIVEETYDVESAAALAIRDDLQSPILTIHDVETLRNNHTWQTEVAFTLLLECSLESDVEVVAGIIAESQ